jgi:hypothetical protein
MTKRALVTGMTSRQANPEASLKDVTFAHLVAQALRAAGWEVEHRNPSIAEDVSSFDLVVAGIAPLHALGSNRVYGTLSAMMRTWNSGKLVIMIDDPDTGKIFSGIRTMVDTPARLTKPFFAYKLEHALASEDPWKGWLAEGVKVLRDAEWPTVIVPKHEWMDVPKLSGANPSQITKVVGVDPTALIDYAAPEPRERRSAWTVEAGTTCAWLNQISPFLHLPVERHGSAGLPRFTKDKERLENYASVRGVIIPTVCNGNWWTSRPALATITDTLALTDWQSVRPLGESWTLTPEQAEGLTGSTVTKTIADQKDSLLAAVPTAEVVGKQLEGLI